MGNSKALMLGAISLIIGMYTLKIKEADRTVSEIGTDRYAEVQALELAKSGVVLAEEDLTAKHEIGYKSVTKVVNGDTLVFVNKDIGSTQQKITSTATVGGQSKTVVAVLRRTSSGWYYSGSSWKEWSRWATTKTYVQP